jgi:hypothetical protein
MLAPLFLAAALTAPTSPATPPGSGPMLRMEQVRIVAVGPRDLPGSGFVAVYANFDIAAPDGAPERMYLLWMGVGQYLPEPGSTCTIGYRRELLAGGDWHDHPGRDVLRDHNMAHNVVYEMDCAPALRLPASVMNGSVSAPEPASANRRIEHGMVMQVSPRPAAGSGVFAIYADFEVATPSGERLRMYVLWMGGNQYLPHVGSVCTISYRNEPLARGNLHNPPARRGQPEGPLNVVHELNCGPPLSLPAPAQRRPIA